MGTTIEFVDTRTAPESLLREMAAYYAVAQAEDFPDDPPTPPEQTIHGWRGVREHEPVKRWLLRDGGDIVAVAVTAYELEQNLDNGFGRIHVHPEHRGKGYARELAGPMFDALEDAGRKRFDTWVKLDHPAADLCESVGLKAVYTDRRSRLVTADLDHDLMRSWIERAQERASDYELCYYLSPVPDDVIDEMCRMAEIMNTAPREDYEADDEVATPALWREYEQMAATKKTKLHNLVAVYVPTGEFAGYTQINTQDLQPDLAWQFDTGVHPDHRNKGLGRWLKAALIERIVEEFPEITRVDTENADSNEPMLNINVAMGFKPVFMSQVWQGDLAEARERFGV